MIQIYDKLFNILRKTLNLSHKETGLIVLVGIIGIISLFLFMNILISLKCGYANVIILFALSLLFLRSSKLIRLFIEYHLEYKPSEKLILYIRYFGFMLLNTFNVLMLFINLNKNKILQNIDKFIPYC